MLKKYQPTEFEKKWADYWNKNKVYKTGQITSNKKSYVLAMFPYPSGAGLHVGHVRNYTGTDVLARFFRMNGNSILHPMGWDAFGLPAENAAIKAHKNPMDMVPEHIATFKKQMQSLGFSYDWDKELVTTDPQYYKWTQWLFIQFYKMGLLYKKDIPINFCPFCKTGLSEEEVLPDGTHERCGTKIIKKELPQWLFKITKYADRLLEDLQGLDWPKGILEMQKNWIGKKEGVLIKHKIKDSNLTFESFSAFPAWLWADTFIVIAPEHPLVKKLINKGTAQEKEVKKFLDEHKTHIQKELEEGKLEKKGVFTQHFALDPFNPGREMPIWIANFALMDFGTGIIRCSAHDVRDFEFAQKYKIHLEEVVERIDPKIPINAHVNRGVLKNSGPFSGKEISPKLIEEILDWIEKQAIGKRELNYHLHDWIFSRQRYWGEPIPMVYCQKDGWQPVPENELPVELPYVKSYEPTGTGESPLAAISEWVNTKCPKCGEPAKRETDTMPNWAGSCWYFIAFTFPNEEARNHVYHSTGALRSADIPSRSKQVSSPPSIEQWSSITMNNSWLPVDWYIGGAEHAVLHLLYSRFWVKALYDLKLLNFKEPFLRLRNQGIVIAEDSRKMSKSFGNVINPDDVIAEYGADTLRVYEMFMAPFSQEIAWSTKALQGAYRFLSRIWKMYHEENYIVAEGKSMGKKLEQKLQKTIRKVTTDIPEMKFNTSIAAMMEFLNEWEKTSNGTIEQSNNALSKKNAQAFLKILAPFAPFMAEEIWHGVFAEKETIHLSTWPKVEEKILEEEIIIPVQVNGKLRATLRIQNSESRIQNKVVERALREEKVKKYLEGKEYKVIYIEGRILSFVAK